MNQQCLRVASRQLLNIPLCLFYIYSNELYRCVSSFSLRISCQLECAQSSLAVWAEKIFVNKKTNRQVHTLQLRLTKKTHTKNQRVFGILYRLQTRLFLQRRAYLLCCLHILQERIISGFLLALLHSLMPQTTITVAAADHWNRGMKTMKSLSFQNFSHFKRTIAQCEISLIMRIRDQEWIGKTCTRLQRWRQWPKGRGL